MYANRSPGVRVRHQALSSGHCPRGAISTLRRFIRQRLDTLVRSVCEAPMN